MFNLTRQERIVLIFITGAIFLGAGIKFGLKRFAKLQPIYNPDLEVSSEDELKINVNSADIQDLIKIPGIGPVLSERIVKYRNLHGPFKNTEDLQKVKGIGPKNINRFKEYITLGKHNNKSN